MRKHAVVFLIAVLVAGAMPLAASTFVAMSPRELVTQADAVIQGRVVAVESFWSDSGRIIVTEATIQVEETILGKAPERVTVRTFGGQVGDMLVEAEGFPKFEADSHVILFLTREPADGSNRVLGYQQGQYEVVTRLDGVTLAVPQAEEGVRYLRPDGRLAPPAQSVRLDAFKDAVREIARKNGRQETVLGQ